MKYIKKFELQILNTKIVQSLGLVYHAKKHLKNFCNLKSFNKTLQGLSKIIKNPYYISYDKDKNSLKYYGKINEYVCVIVNLTNKENFVSTFYPIGKNKIDKKMHKENE